MVEIKVKILKSIYKIMKIMVDFLFKINIKGQENIPLPKASGVLIVANHCSYLDIPVIARTFYNNLINLSWVISKENYRYWLLKWLFLLFRIIVVNGTIEKVKKELKNNRWVVIFPEGAGRWCDCSKKAIKLKRGKGAAAIALSTGVSIIPVALSGTDKVMPPTSFKMNPLHTITVNIGKPFKFEVRGDEKIPDMLLEEKTNEIMERINASQK